MYVTAKRLNLARKSFSIFLALSMVFTYISPAAAFALEETPDASNYEIPAEQISTPDLESPNQVVEAETPEPQTTEPTEPEAADTAVETQPEVVEEETTEIVDLPTPAIAEEDEETTKIWVDGASRKYAESVSTVQKDVVYSHPLIEGLSVKFTSLPETSSKIQFSEITLTTQEKLALNSLSDYAYEITTDMPNGSFKYELTLPYEGSQKAKVIYAAERDTLPRAKSVTEKTTKVDDSIKVEGLNHFTVFVVVPDDIIPSLSSNYFLQGWRLTTQGSAQTSLVEVADHGATDQNGDHSIRMNRVAPATGPDRSYLGYYEAGRTLSSLESVSWDRFTNTGSDTYLNIFLATADFSNFATVVYAPSVNPGAWSTYEFSSAAGGTFTLRSGGVQTEMTWDELMASPYASWSISNHCIADFVTCLLPTENVIIGGIVLVSGSSGAGAAQDHLYDNVSIKFAGSELQNFDFVNELPPVFVDMEFGHEVAGTYGEAGRDGITECVLNDHVFTNQNVSGRSRQVLEWTPVDGAASYRFHSFSWDGTRWNQISNRVVDATADATIAGYDFTKFDIATGPATYTELDTDNDVFRYITRGTGEGIYTRTVQAWSNADGTGDLLGETEVSATDLQPGGSLRNDLNVCSKMTIDRTNPAVADVELTANGVPATEIEEGQTVRISLNYSDDPEEIASGLDQIEVWIRNTFDDSLQIVEGEMICDMPDGATATSCYFEFVMPATYENGDDIDETVVGNYFDLIAWDRAGNRVENFSGNFTFIPLNDYTASIQGRKFNDTTQTGYQYDNTIQPNLSGWDIRLYDNSWNLVDSLNTNGAGQYTFNDIAVGSYRVCEANQDGWTQTSPSLGMVPTTLASTAVTPVYEDNGARGVVNLSGNVAEEAYYCWEVDVQDDDGFDIYGYLKFGNTPLPAPTTGDLMVCKEDVDGERLDGWTFNLDRDNGEVVSAALNVATPAGTSIGTFPAGQYEITVSGMYQYRAGTYGQVDAGYSRRNEANLPDWMSGYHRTVDGSIYGLSLRINDTCTDVGCFSMANRMSGLINWGPYSPSHTYTTYYNHPGGEMRFSIRDNAYGDNASGNMAVTVSGLNGATDTYSGVTDDTGCVMFEDLLVGDYNLGEELQAGWAFESRTDGGANGDTVVIEEGENSVTFVNRGDRMVQGQKWEDVDGDGVRDLGGPDQLLSNWGIYLFDASWDYVDHMQTGADNSNANPNHASGNVSNGQYRFRNLTPGLYYVCEISDANWYQSGFNPTNVNRQFDYAGDPAYDMFETCLSANVTNAASATGIRFLNVEYSTITICKIDSESGEAIEGVEFSLYDGEDFVDSLTTGVDGCLTFEQLEPSDNYQVVEEYTSEWVPVTIYDPNDPDTVLCESSVESTCHGYTIEIESGDDVELTFVNLALSLELENLVFNEGSVPGMSQPFPGNVDLSELESALVASATSGATVNCDWDTSPTQYVNLVDTVFTVTCYVNVSGVSSDDVVATVTVRNLVPGAAISNQATQLVANPSAGNPGYTYQWGGDCSGNTSTVNKSTTPGTYNCSVTVRDIDGDTSVVNVQYVVAEEPVVEPPAPPAPAPAPIVNPAPIEQDEEEVLGEETEEESEEEDSGDILGVESCEIRSMMSGRIYHDNNNDGKHNGSERRFKDVTVEIYAYVQDEDGNLVRKLIRTVKSDSDGKWEAELCPANYEVELKDSDIPEDYELIDENFIKVTLRQDQDTKDVDFLLEALSSGFNWRYLLCLLPILLIGIIAYIYKRRQDEESKVS